MFYNVGDTFDCMCQVDLTSFPWDTQKCNLEVTTWGYVLSELELVPLEDVVGTTKYRSDGEWILHSTKVSTAPNAINSVVVFEHILKRRSVFFFVNIILPVVTLSVLTVFVFFIPIDSGERISFSLTLLLSTAVFITLISESLPPNAETMATVCYLLLCVMVHNTVTCILNIVSLHIYFKSNADLEPGKIWNGIFKLFTWKPKCSKVNPTKNFKKSSDEEEDGCTIKPYDEDESMQMEVAHSTVTWKTISGMLDIFFFCLMTLLLIVSYAMYACLVLKAM